jgi:hypothetical protein
MARAPGLLVFLLLGCGTASPSIPDNRPPELPPRAESSATGTEVRLANNEQGVARKLAVPPGDVWTALTEVYQDLELEPDFVDPRTHQIGNRRLTRSQVAGEAAEALVRCASEGSGPSAANRFRITLSILSRVDAAGADSQLRTTVTGSASRVDGSSVSRVNCFSKGILEKRILDGVGLKLGIATSQ